MTNAEIEELAEIIRKFELGDDKIEPLLDLYITVKRMITNKRPELLSIKVYDQI